MFVGRLPNGMFPLGIVFVLHQHSGSYSAAGAALAALMLGITCSAPFRGRAVDRWGQSHTLIPLVVVQATTMTAFLLAVWAKPSTLIVIPLVAMVGATSSTLGGSMRQIWPTLVRSARDLPAAYALQALLEDLISVAGPLIASALLLVAPPMAILVFAEVAALTGTTVFATATASRAATGRPARGSSLLGALSTPGMRTLVLTLLAAGMVVGMLYIAVPAFTQGPDGESAGTLLAVMAASSMASGLLYGGRTWTSDADRRYLWLAGLFAAAAAPLALATTVTQLGVLLAFVGLAYAPRMISAYLLLDDLAPADSLAEAYTWLVSASAAGTALGSAIAGPITQHAGPQWALAGTGAVALTSYALVAARRETLKHRDPRP
ncbi:MFS transporter [Actinophytocola sp.]|uniref:MFS transporter n=1 Tax=Actinophytocola sp. TaxID=1872138 RepID=UPI003899AB1D